MITALLGDITRLDFDIAVIAVNEKFEPMNEISKTVFQKGGEFLQKECERLGKGKLGSAKMTDIPNCPYKKVIHAVPPIYIDGNHKEDRILEAMYWNSMVLAFSYLQDIEAKQVTLAFSSMQIEGHRYPSQRGAQIAAQTIQAIYQKYRDAKRINVVFVCDNAQDYASIKGEIRKK